MHSIILIPIASFLRKRSCDYLRNQILVEKIINIINTLVLLTAISRVLIFKLC